MVRGYLARKHYRRLRRLRIESAIKLQAGKQSLDFCRSLGDVLGSNEEERFFILLFEI